MDFTLDFVIYSHHFQEWTGTEWILNKYKPFLIKTDSFNTQIRISHVDHDLIQQLVNDYVEKLTKSSQQERILFESGIYLTKDNISIDYSCCGEFCDYRNWERILIERKMDWEEIWIGHPWIYYKIEDKTIHFSKYYDKNKEFLTNIETQLIIDYENFENKLKNILYEIEIFKEKTLQYLEQEYKERKEIIYNTMFNENKIWA